MADFNHRLEISRNGYKTASDRVRTFEAGERLYFLLFKLGVNVSSIKYVELDHLHRLWEEIRDHR